MPARGLSGVERTLALVPAVVLTCGLASAKAETLPDPMLDTKLATAPASKPASIVLAGGCFWGVQAVFQHVKGVNKAVSGYAGGDETTAHYDMVSSGSTRHAESVKIEYDPAQITLGTLLKVFFSVAHNPTEVNRQGPDFGTQYRSAIFFADEQQRKIAEAYIHQLDNGNFFRKPIATKIEALNGFYAAEDYHQDYAKTHPYSPYIVMHDLPKVENLRERFPGLYIQ